ncbi:peroxidase 44 [Ziziphus jujuba]|uniref:Peroxidase n=1 Tax=Ziziphus jujuba TaxID=326968 RepID=A0A9B4ERF1_ZIZJJ|nr:peroxidase 44 [Ziziphus jujuba]
MSTNAALLACLLQVVFIFPAVMGQLLVGFYNSVCPRAESIIREVVQNQSKTNPFVTAGLLRMHFHDCFVRGCDASILIDPTKNKPSEKSAGPNLSVRGYEVIDDAKKRLEVACPNKVSCADIIALATRDAVTLAGGPNYSVPTGRRDGLVSNPNDVNLPGPSSSVSDALQAFINKGMTLNDMTTLLGAHTVGVAHCQFFQDRLFDFQGSGSPDPSMDAALVTKLQKLCGTQSKPLDSDPAAFLDQNTSFVFDNQFYNQIIQKKGILQIDQELTSDSRTSGIVSGFAFSGTGFTQSFASAIVKMGSIEVLAGNAGEIRKNCRVFNTRRA